MNPGGDGGGLFLSAGNLAIIDRCTFLANRAGGGGGGLKILNVTSNSVLRNSVLNGNIAWNAANVNSASGGGAFVADVDAAVINCTIVHNTVFGTNGRGGGVRTWGPMHNCITWFNDAPAGTGAGVYFTSQATFEPLLLAYSNTQNPIPAGHPGGAGNIAADPLFVLAAGADGIPGTPDDNLRLVSLMITDSSSNSPCVDSGNKAVANGLTDLDRDPRTEDNPLVVDAGIGSPPQPDPPQIDMGAFETNASDQTCPGDTNLDYHVGFDDLNLVLDNWGETVPPGGPGHAYVSGFSLTSMTLTSSSTIGD